MLKFDDLFDYYIIFAGNFYIADYYNYRVRKVTLSTGFISTIAGSNSAGYNGDNIAATSAELYNPLGTAVDSSGMLITTIDLLHTLLITPICI